MFKEIYLMSQNFLSTKKGFIDALIKKGRMVSAISRQMSCNSELFASEKELKMQKKPKIIKTNLPQGKLGVSFADF